MKVVIIGMGVQGNKRKKFLGSDFLYSVDKFKKANFKTIQSVPKKAYDAVFVCVPDNQKLDIVKYCLKNNKHLLIEKPFLIKNKKQLNTLSTIAKKNKLVFYTAYNHRFEPNIIKLKKFLDKKLLGKIYSCRIFYGNGTSMLVKKSKWRDKGRGVLTDIGSHLFDMCFFLFGEKYTNLKLSESNKFENKSSDHTIVTFKKKNMRFELEMSLCSWMNNFTCDIYGSKGSAHLNSLCKWSKSSFTFRKRKFPSGKPNEINYFFTKGDPTWNLEYKFFKKLVKTKNKKTSFKKDLKINNLFKKLTTK